MNLTEAINQLKRGTVENRSTANKMLREALRLGVEALKETLETRLAFPDLEWTLLPGETKE